MNERSFDSPVRASCSSTHRPTHQIPPSCSGALGTPPPPPLHGADCTVMSKHLELSAWALCVYHVLAQCEAHRRCSITKDLGLHEMFGVLAPGPACLAPLHDATPARPGPAALEASKTHTQVLLQKQSPFRATLCCTDTTRHGL